MSDKKKFPHSSRYINDDVRHHSKPGKYLACKYKFSSNKGIGYEPLHRSSGGCQRYLVFDHRHCNLSPLSPCYTPSIRLYWYYYHCDYVEIWTSRRSVIFDTRSRLYYICHRLGFTLVSCRRVCVRCSRALQTLRWFGETGLNLLEDRDAILTLCCLAFILVDPV